MSTDLTPEQRERLRECANRLDQLFRQRHTTSDVEAELRSLLRYVVAYQQAAPREQELNPEICSNCGEQELTTRLICPTCGTPYAAPAEQAAPRSPPREPTYERLLEAYQYLQHRLESIGYHGWAHDKDDAIAALVEQSAAVERDARDAARLKWLDNNTSFYDVDADWPVEGHNIPPLAQVSNRIWYHATDDQTSYPFSAVIDAAIAEQAKERA